MHIVSGALGHNTPGAYAEQVQLSSLLVAAGALTDVRDARGRTVLEILDSELER